MAVSRFWVVGGVYVDTRFEQLATGGAEERIGPFPTYAAAKDAWQRRAWATVDDAHARFRIEEEDAGHAAHYWVVGGIYKDTRFIEPVAGAEQWYGPFDSYEAAKAEWGRRAWATVDDAHARYRIEKRIGDPRRP